MKEWSNLAQDVTITELLFYCIIFLPASFALNIDRKEIIQQDNRLFHLKPWDSQS